MTDTPSWPLTLKWLRRLDPNLHRYDWDAQKLTGFSRCPKINSLFDEIAARSKSLASQSYDMSHITVNSGSSVSIISALAVNLGSHSYRSHLDHFDPVIFSTPNKIYLLDWYPLLHVTEHLDPFQTCALLIPLSQDHSFWISIKISTFINFVLFDDSFK